jgi:hypothetical protein
MQNVQPSSPRVQPLLRTGLPIAILILLWMLFFWRTLTPNPIDRVIFAEGDFTQHYYAFASYQVERLWQGQFPLWNPYNHSGDPFAGNIQFSAFYPPRLIGALLLGQDGYSIEDYQLEVAVHYWLASLMMFAFLRLYFGRVSTALFGSILYTYSGYLTGYPLLQVSVLESVVWLPLIMLGVHLSITRPGWRFGGCVVGGIGIALSLFGGHPQTTMQITYLAVAYLVFLGYRRGLGLLQIALRLFALGLIGAGLSALQLIPALEFTRLSYRVTSYGYLDKANGFNPSDFFQLFVPGIFGVWSPLYLGAAGLLLAVIGLLRPHPNRAFWIGVIVVGLFLSLGGDSIVYDFFYLVVPGFNIFRQQERIVSVVVFALVVLACEGLAGLNREAVFPTRIVYGYAAFLFLVTVVVTAASVLQTGGGSTLTNALAFATVTAILLAIWYGWGKNHESWQTHALLILLIVVDLFTIGTRSANYVPDTVENRVQLSEPLRDLPTSPQDIHWRVDGAAGVQGYGVYFRIPDVYGTGPFTLATIEELRKIPVDRFWEVLSVRYASAIDEPPQGVALELLAYGRNYEGAEYKLFELQNPRPMAHLVYDYRQSEGTPEFARQIMSDSRVNLREMGITLYPLPFELPVTRPEVSRVENFSMVTPEQVEMTVSTGTDALLTLSIPKYPGWQAAINGEPVEIVDVYAGLIGIPVRAGENQQVVLTFAPQSILIGAAVTGMTLTLITAGFFIPIPPLRRILIPKS